MDLVGSMETPWTLGLYEGNYWDNCKCDGPIFLVVLWFRLIPQRSCVTRVPKAAKLLITASSARRKCMTRRFCAAHEFRVWLTIDVGPSIYQTILETAREWQASKKQEAATRLAERRQKQRRRQNRPRRKSLHEAKRTRTTTLCCRELPFRDARFRSSTRLWLISRHRSGTTDMANSHELPPADFHGFSIPGPKH